jgi:ADP-ribose pyrophosphatase YjhB (NUDIX family)
MHNEIYCNNCGKNGHLYHQCKLPITSIGIVAFRINNNIPEFLMIRRKDTLGHVDFMRGKYTLHNKGYILNMLNQMTRDEKEKIKVLEFKELWNNVWGGGDISLQYKNEENVSRDKFNALKNGVYFNNELCTLEDLVDESNSLYVWEEPEWGFPKGRRNNRESDYDCAIREFTEETGYNSSILKNLQNIIPYEEIFTGSNYKSYKHKYFLMFTEHINTLTTCNFEKSEVSKMEWKSYDACLLSIRHYNIEKKRILTNIHNTINENIII